jgi:hypothetical protein
LAAWLPCIFISANVTTPHGILLRLIYAYSGVTRSAFLPSAALGPEGAPAREPQHLICVGVRFFVLRSEKPNTDSRKVPFLGTIIAYSRNVLPRVIPRAV